MLLALALAPALGSLGEDVGLGIGKMGHELREVLVGAATGWGLLGKRGAQGRQLFDLALWAGFRSSWGCL